jgi:hypothetical protein
MSCSTLEAQYYEGQIYTGVDVTPPIVYQPSFSTPITSGIDTGFVSPQNSWYPYVIARPGDRQWLRQTPIELRPNRPMHFLGNSRRRTWR